MSDSESSEASQSQSPPSESHSHSVGVGVDSNVAPNGGQTFRDETPPVSFDREDNNVRDREQQNHSVRAEPNNSSDAPASPSQDGSDAKDSKDSKDSKETRPHGDVAERPSRRNRGSRKRKRKGNRDGSREAAEPSAAERPRETNVDSGDDFSDDFSDDFDEEGDDDDLGDSEDNQEGGENRPRKTRKQRYLERREKERAREAAALEVSPAVESEGLVEISPKGFGFLRERIRGFQQSPKDVFITPEVVRIYGLRDGLMVRCISKQGVRGPQLIELLAINGNPPEECAKLPYFEELTAINPNKKLTLETDSNRTTTRVIDLVAPIGRGQRGLIVAPPRTGKTTLLHHIAEGLLKNYEEEIHLMVLLVDERPEEVTDFERSFPGVEIFSSSNDS